MLLSFLISLAAVLAFAAFEKIHQKGAYNVQTAWPKYVCALVFGTFGFKYLIEWKYFQYLELAAFVLAFLWFFWSILAWLKIRGVPGQAAKIALIPIIGLCLASVSAKAQVNTRQAWFVKGGEQYLIPSAANVSHIQDTSWLKPGMQILYVENGVKVAKVGTIAHEYVVLFKDQSKSNALYEAPNGLFYEHKNDLLFTFTDGRAYYGQAIDIIGFIKH